jgi:hypothetical protein
MTPDGSDPAGSPPRSSSFPNEKGRLAAALSESTVSRSYPPALDCEVAVHCAVPGDSNTARIATFTPQRFAAAEIGT